MLSNTRSQKGPVAGVVVVWHLDSQFESIYGNFQSVAGNGADANYAGERSELFVSCGIAEKDV